MSSAAAILQNSANNTPTEQILLKLHRKQSQSSILSYPYRFINTYYYFTPSTVLSKGEEIVFHTIAAALFLFTAYWVVYRLPLTILLSSESIYYYLTGNTDYNSLQLNKFKVLAMGLWQKILGASAHTNTTAKGGAQVMDWEDAKQSWRSGNFAHPAAGMLMGRGASGRVYDMSNKLS